MLKRLFTQAETLAKWTAIKDSKISKSGTKLSEFQLKRVKVLTEAINTLSFDEKEYLWQRIRDSYVQMLGIDPALMSDFFPKLQGNEFDLDNIKVPSASCVGMIEAARGKIIPIVKEDKKNKDELKKEAKPNEKTQDKQEQAKKPQDKVNEKQAKDKKK